MAKAKRQRTEDPPAGRRGRRGLKCPRCGCRMFRTATTVPLAGQVRRYRVCRHCGRRIRTRETIDNG